MTRVHKFVIKFFELSLNTPQLGNHHMIHLLWLFVLLFYLCNREFIVKISPLYHAPKSNNRNLLHTSSKQKRKLVVSRVRNGAAVDGQISRRFNYYTNYTIIMWVEEKKTCRHHIATYSIQSSIFTTLNGRGDESRWFRYVSTQVKLLTWFTPSPPLNSSQFSVSTILTRTIIIYPRK